MGQKIRTIAIAVMALVAGAVVRSDAQTASVLSAEDFTAWKAASDGSACETRVSAQPPYFILPSFYPEPALESKVSGDVLVVFDVGPGRTIENARVVAGTQPRLFDAAAIALIPAYTFPVSLGTCSGIRMRVTFDIDIDRRGRAKPRVDALAAMPPISADATQQIADSLERCGDLRGLPTNAAELGRLLPRLFPRKALNLGYAGVAVVRASIGTDGVPANIALVEAWPQSLGFEEAAVAAVGEMRFQPRETICEGAVLRVEFAA